MPHRLIRDGELYLYGSVGLYDFFDDAGFTASEVLEALVEMEGDITVHINSGGGYTSHGIAIFNALKARDSAVTVIVDALAASSASIIAMAGTEIIMAEGALLMIHNATGWSEGTAKDHRTHATALDKLTGAMAAIYAKRSGGDLAAIREAMDAETWFDGADAVAMGFATSNNAAANDNKAEASAWNYRLYAKAPQELVAMADRWTAEGRFARPSFAALAAKPRQQQEIEMAGKPTGGDENPAITALTAETLKAQNPALFAAIAAEGGAAELARIKGVEDALIPGHEALINGLKFDGKTSPGDAALAVNRAERAKGKAYLSSLDEDEKKMKGLKSEPPLKDGKPAAASASKTGAAARAFIAQQKKLGITISAAEAVDHVSAEA